MYFRAIRIIFLVGVACLPAIAAVAQTTPPPSPPAAGSAQPPAQPTATTNLPLGISAASSWKFERVGDHLHLIDQAAIEGPNLKFFADDVDLYEGTNRVVAIRGCFHFSEAIA